MLKTIFKRLFALGIVFAFVGLLAIVYLYNTIDDELQEIVDFNPKQTLRIFDRNGDLVANVYRGEHRILIDYHDIPPFAIEALIAAEDTDFFEHNGINLNAIFRAILKDIRHQALVEGASTITQQLVRTSILTREKKLTRKIKEALYSIKLETILNKEEILYRYFNKIYFGHRYYGIATASLGYYKKNIKDLKLKEIAMLIALIKAPSYYDPTKHYEQALKRANVIINRMKSLGWLNEYEYENAIEFRPVVYDESISQNKAPYVVDYALSKLKKQIPDIKTGGYEVHLTIDLKAQELAKQALWYGYNDIVTRMDFSNETLKKFVHYKDINMTTLAQYAYFNLTNSTDDNLSNTTNTSNIDAYLADYKEFNATEAMEKKLRLLNGAMIITEPRSGNILAMLGGVDYKQSPFNRAVQAKRQPGSLVKPFVYLIALNSGYSVKSPIADISRNYRYKDVDIAKIANDTDSYLQSMQKEKIWSPKNYANNYKGIITLQTALTHSINLATINLVGELGLKKVYKNLVYFGFKNVPQDMSIVLGSFGASPYDISRQFSIFSNGGVKLEPKLIDYVVDKNKNINYFENKKTFITTKEQAFLLTSILMNVVNKGTGRRAKQKNMQIAGKTGTTNKNKDAWFAGFSPNLQIITWYGNDDNSPMGKGEVGSRAPVRAFAYFHKRWSKSHPRMRKKFEVPKGVYKTKTSKGGYYFTDTSPAVTIKVNTQKSNSDVLF